MTDSMKFGPEWLRNMSADSTVSNSMCGGGQLTNSALVSSSGGTLGPSNGRNHTSLTSSNSNVNNSSLHNTNAPSSGASRNTFPEFRYGREEMLLLFDRNCSIPEILPTFKNLFVDKVQLPLALVPSTDEEVIMQGTTPPTQRPAWLQRSPLGFSSSTRGTGRGGTTERGRMRGKSVYHPVFQRPNPMFAEDQRSPTVKTDRPWAQRNGGVDTVASGHTSTVSGVGADAWNGNTPALSPRREFSSHSRNMENWRRSRNEDAAGDTATTATAAPFAADGGWRMNSSGFQNPHTRWGRSTSWRDEDLVNNENPGIATASSGGVPFSAGGIIMQRSYSTISTSQNMAKHATGGYHPGGSGGGTTRTVSASSSGGRQGVGGNAWPNNVQTGAVSSMSTSSPSEGVNEDLSLPEWAMENPSDIGGTFDASGAFHGVVDNDNDHHNHAVPVEHHRHQDDEDKSGIDEYEAEFHELLKTSEDHSNKSSNEVLKNTIHKETDNFIDSKTPSPAPSLTNIANYENSDNSAESDKIGQENRSGVKDSATAADTIQEKDSQNAYNQPEHHDFNKDSSNISNAKNFTDNVLANNNAAGDYAERMMKVADDMIEKLIMDDEEAKEVQMKSSSSGQHVFVNALQQQQNANHQTASPGIAGPPCPPNMSMPGIYNMAGMIVDHTHNMAALHQLQQQQMAAVAAVAIGLQPPPPPHSLTSAGPTDLWLYRDPQAKVQGPFSALEMTEWYRAGYFNENLFVRRVCDTRYRALGELIKICNGQMPFNNSHLIPIDLNSSPLTPPLQPNLASVQPISQTTDFVMKTLSEHHQHQHEELKGNVTAAADSLSNALKSLINSVDMSQVLNMHFQTLQDRFIRNQEMEIVNELSKNECFQRLTASEQESVVRQKLQMMVLPEYLTNLNGLCNSLAALNPTAQTQLYDTIAECSKKEQLFNNTNQQQQGPNQQHLQSHNTSSATTFMNAEDFTMKTSSSSKSARQDLGSSSNANDLLNEFNLRMFLNNSDTSTAVAVGGSGGGGSVATPNSHGNEFLYEQQVFGAAGAPTNHSTTNASQSPMMQMWMTQLASNQPPQQQIMTAAQQQQQQGVNNQWLNGPLVRIPAIGLAREHHAAAAAASGGTGMMGVPKPIPTSMWDVATLEQHVHQQQLQQKHQEQQLQHNFEQNRHSTEKPRQQQEHEQQQQLQEINKKIKQDGQQQQQKANIVPQKQTDSKDSSNDVAVICKEQQRQQQQPQNQPSSSSSIEKLYSQQNTSNNNNNNKRNANNNIVKQAAAKPTTKNDSVIVNTANKKNEEERRREQNEEKRRQKDERKRQQIEDEKRRLLQIEEEKRRQLQEEEKRQQQIQAQRRKALMGSNNGSTNNNNSVNDLLPSNSYPTSSNIIVSGSKSNNKEQQRIQSSVAPWSTQILLAEKSQGPGLAEIQKAERRERRADQQRQLEIHEKQMRALAAAAESQDSVLKWNAAPVQVKSFAEIQAEEAKRLAHEQMETQRRKEHESSTNLVNFSSGMATTPVAGLTASSNLSGIWSGTKIWGATANTTGFWEEPNKYSGGSGAASSPSLNNINNNNSNVTVANVVAQSSVSLQPKQQQSLQQPQQHSVQQQSSPSKKNIKKSQSAALVQNNIHITASSSSGGMVSKSSSSSNNLKGLKSTAAAAVTTNKSVKQLKPQENVSNAAADNKKTVTKSNNINVSKCDDYETDFINWCTKSLNNMNAKVDVPTFVSFLRDLESPYEVKDYIRMYLGETKEYIDFAKQFLERRSKYKNLQRAQNAHNDDLCKPAQAITPSANDSNENKNKQKKVKKNKMMKLDARILGFSVTAAEGRINVGDRDYVDGP